MKKVIEKYYCDVCNKEVGKEKDLKNIVIPIPYYCDRETITSNQGICICDECNEALKYIIQQHFADIKLIWYAGIEIDEVKYKQSDDNCSETLKDIIDDKGLSPLGKSNNGLYKID